MISSTRRSSELLRESERKLVAILQNMLEGMVTVDLTGQITYANKAASEILEIKLDEVAGKYFQDREWNQIDEDGKPYPQDKLPLAIALSERRSVEKFEHGIVEADGKSKWLSVNAAPLFDVNGNLIGGIASFRDITKSRLDELALKRSERLLHDSQKAAKIGGYITSLSTGIWECTDTMDELFGITKSYPHTIEGWVGFMHPEFNEPMDEYLHMVIRDRKPFNAEYKVIRPSDGVERWMHGLGQIVYDVSGNAVSLVGTVQDITERKETEIHIGRSEEKYRSLADNGQAFIWTAGTDSLCNYFNKVWLEFTGRTMAQEMGNGWTEGVHPDDMQRCLDVYIAAFDRRESFSMDYRLRHHSGAYRWIEDRGTPRYDEQGEFIGYIGHCLDVDYRYKAEASLLKLSHALEQSPNSIFITDVQGNIEYANKTFLLSTGFSEGETIGQNPRFQHSGKTPKSVYEDLWSHIKSGENWQGELINIRKDGSEYVESVLISPVKNSQGEVINFLAVKTDITERKAAELRIEKLAHFDSLTGLPNKNLLLDRFKYATSIAQRNKEFMAVMFIDIDHFKHINESLGHSIGDQLLTELSIRLKAKLREGDILSRMGGDEFILVLPNTDSEGAALVASHLIEEISLPFQIEVHELFVTPSIGITIYPSDGTDFETLAKNADVAMYRVKQAGRNGYRFYTSEMQTKSERTLLLSTALRHALRNNELHLVYQPQLSIEDGRVIGAEALLRWKHPELGMISPAEFIPLAEDGGQIIPIGEWVIRTAAKQMKEWITLGLPPMIMAVNISSIQFRQEGISALVASILDEIDLPHEYFEMELTEAVAMGDPDGAIAIMNSLLDRGIQMSVDDFGTGYSSLSYLKKFKVYKLKIDQSFIRDISHDPEDKAIVTSIINMASGLGIKTIAEGVETAAQLLFLRMQGCDEVQGYYFSKPVMPDEFEVFVRKTIN